jgi:hypothetical protein
VPGYGCLSLVINGFVVSNRLDLVDFRRRLARTIAPIIATNSKTEVTSKGSKYWLNNSRPIAVALP